MGRSALHYAALEDDHAKVSQLLDRGADHNLQERRQAYTPLHFAAQERFAMAPDIRRRAVESGTRVRVSVPDPERLFLTAR